MFFLQLCINGSRKANVRLGAGGWEEVLTMQTWISLLAENEGSQVMDTECSKEKFLTTYKRLSCLHTSSTVRPWLQGNNDAGVNRQLGK